MTIDRLADVALIAINLALLPYFVFLIATTIAALASRRVQQSWEICARVPDHHPGA